MGADALALGVSLGLAAPQAADPAFLPLAMAIFGLAGLYRRDAWDAEELKRIFAAMAVLTVLLVAISPAVAATELALFNILGLIGVTGLRMGLGRWSALRLVLHPPMVLAGLGLERDSFAYQMRASRAGQPTVLRGAPLRALTGRGRSGLDTWLHRLAARAGVQVRELQVVLLPAVQEASAARQLATWLTELRQPFTIGFAEGPVQGRNAMLSSDLGADVLLAHIAPRQPAPMARIAKRGLDIVLATLALILLAPLLGLIWAGLVSEGGAVIFAQTRVGRGGRRFRCLKFRTMRMDAEDRLALLLDCNPVAQAEWARHQKLADDPRVTRLGRVLRASSLDELPQFLNVLKGDMSLVGPRPIVAPEVPGYDADRAYYQSDAFHDYAGCTPGLTGLWQVCGRHQTAHAERIRLDRWYARNWSIWLDLVILLRTVRVVVMGDGR
ncbi:MAG: sugar transferase [Pseudomonadota bacterium]